MDNRDSGSLRGKPAKEVLTTDLIGEENNGKANRKPPRQLWIPVLLVAMYLILLLPYVIAANSGEAGIVKEVQAVEAASLPSDIQDLLVDKTALYSVVLIEDPIHSVTNANGQISKERMLVLSTVPTQVNEFVRVDNTVISFHAPPTLTPSLDQTYDTLIIGDVKQVGFGILIKGISILGLSSLLFVSQLVFLVGGILLVLLISYWTGKVPAIWNIPAIIVCYSFMFFLASRIAIMNHIDTDLSVLAFTLLFIPALFLTVWVRRAEETREWRQFISSFYRGNMELFGGLSARLKSTLGIG